MFRQVFQREPAMTASGDVEFGRSALDDPAVARWAPTVLGAAALALALGAVHLEYAAGHGLSGPAQAAAGMPAVTLSVRADDGTAAGVNRAAKADRVSVVRNPGGVTLSFKVPGVDGVSVATRMPAADAADAFRKAPAAPATSRGPATPRAVACEPVVSVLTAVAKQLEPGRCVT